MSRTCCQRTGQPLLARPRFAIVGLIGACLLWCIWPAVAQGSQATQQVDGDQSAPNVLIIMADDCTYNDLPLYGGVNAKTPNIDRLARQGLTFDRAYLSEAMCQPCRAELFTGQFPLRNGCAWNHSASLATTRSMPHFLRQKPL